MRSVLALRVLVTQARGEIGSLCGQLLLSAGCFGACFLYFRTRFQTTEGIAAKQRPEPELGRRPLTRYQSTGNVVIPPRETRDYYPA
jgi:hypothetical protein